MNLLVESSTSVSILIVVIFNPLTDKFSLPHPDMTGIDDCVFQVVLYVKDTFFVSMGSIGH